MSNKWRNFPGHISAQDAEREPEADRLFGPSYERRQRQLAARSAAAGIDRASYRPWRKPTIDRRGTISAANNHAREGVSDREIQARRAGAERKGIDRTLGSD